MNIKYIFLRTRAIYGISKKKAAICLKQMQPKEEGILQLQNNRLQLQKVITYKSELIGKIIVDPFLNFGPEPFKVFR